jgi:hypothetical protein
VGLSGNVTKGIKTLCTKQELKWCLPKFLDYRNRSIFDVNRIQREREREILKFTDEIQTTLNEKSMRSIEKILR